MKIKVLEINKHGNDEILVTFSSPYGSAHGFWMEQNPEINKSYHVELDIPQTLFWEKDIKEAEFNECKIGGENDNIFICAMFDSFDDHCLTIRFGESIILIDTEGDPNMNSKFLTICFRKINIYPYAL
jgi:hypothetical protein